MKKFLTILAAAILVCAPSSFAQNRLKVSGTVVDDKGETLVGAIVVLKGPNNTVKASATADINGKYTIECQKGDILEAFFLGYTNKQMPVNGTKIDFMLSPDSSTMLDETVVIGYGEVKKSDLTGSVANVKMADIRDEAVSSIDQALQGRIAGVDITSVDGDPGATSTIQIRGSRSINASNEPLIVVDGVADAISDLNDIAPADIESISVLKDASSTAIYGARGANGVILITTKGANSNIKDEKMSVTFKATAGVNFLERSLDIMNATEFALYRDEYSFSTSTASKTNPISSYSVADPYSKGEGTDWIREVTRVAPTQDYLLSFNGRSGSTYYYVSMGYNNNQGIIQNSGQQRYTVTANLSTQAYKWLRIGANLRYEFRHNDENLAALGGTGIYYSAVYLSPLINPGDSYNPFYGSGTRVNNPRVRIDNNINYTNRSMMTITPWVEANIAKHLQFKGKFSYFYFDRGKYKFWPSTLPARQEGEGAEAQREEYGEQSFNFDATLNYNKNFNKNNHFDAMVGFNGKSFESNNMSVYGKGYLVDESKWYNLGGVQDKETYSISSSSLLRRSMSTFARVNYNFKKKYYITATARYDGSSNFAANKKWGFFPSAALKWTISNENWMKGARNVDELALKLSAGRAGNDAITAYRSQARLDSSTSGYIFGGSQPVAYYPARIESPDLSWETTDQYNVSLNGSFFNSRLNFTAEAYYAYTHDLLLTVQTPQTTGYNNRYYNVGSTSNRGVELSIDSRNIVKRKFSWTTTFTISHNTQLVEDIGTENYISAKNSPEGGYMMAGYVNGYPLHSLWGFQYAGVWHNTEEVERNKITHAYVNQSLAESPGSVIYVDVNHDGSLNIEDICYLGSGDPVLHGGLQNSFRLGKFKFQFFLAYSLGGKVYNFQEYYMAGCRRTNQYRYMVNAWHPYKNPDSNLPRAGSLDGSNVPSSFMVHDASYLRLKNLSVSYTLNFKKFLFKDAVFTLAGNNLWLWTKYNGFDPDVSLDGQRIDQASYPKATTCTFSIQLRY